VAPGGAAVAARPGQRDSVWTARCIATVSAALHPELPWHPTWSPFDFGIREWYCCRTCQEPGEIRPHPGHGLAGENPAEFFTGKLFGTYLK